MNYGSVCSGIEAASVAWEPLGWKASFFSEIEKFPRAVLAHHWPDIPCHGDFTTIKADQYDTIDVLVGGTPCQSFSIAGKRAGLDDTRGELSLEFVALARRLRPRWVVWENVPGVLSSAEGRDFGTFLGALGESGYGFAWRVLDAQYFGVPQRRKRVFLVGHIGGDAQPCASVLFEPESMRGDSPPSREAGQRPAPTISARTKGGGGLGTDFELDGGLIPDVVGTISDGAHNGGGLNGQDAYSGRILPVPPVAFDCKGSQVQFTEDGVAPTLRSMSHDGSHANGGGHAAVADQWAVRRLTPRECERLQGFPDDRTRIAWRGKAPEDCPDGPRYKACGNSMAVPVMRWIGERLAFVDSIYGKDMT